MTIREAFAWYTQSIVLLSEETQLWYKNKLTAFLAWCETESFHKSPGHPDGHVLNLEDVSATELRKYLHYLSTRETKALGRSGTLASSTVHGHARAIRTFLNWCSDEDGLEQYIRPKLTKNMTMPRIEQKVLETFRPNQIEALFCACEREYAPHLVARDKAILALLLDTGIRAQELVTLTLGHLHLKESYLLVHGKGWKDREIGIGEETKKVLQTYITQYRTATGTIAKEEQHVFLSRFSQPLTRNGLEQLLIRLAEWAQITGVRCSAHTFRHTFAVEYLRNGGDVFKLSLLLGHTHVQITCDIYLKAFKSRDARADRLSVFDRSFGQVG